MFRTNRLKRDLRSGKPCTGAWLFCGSPVVGEILGGQGFDALIIDQEHSPQGVETTIETLRAIECAGQTTVLVRIGNSRADTLKVVLDSGAEGIVVPNVESAEEARELIMGCRFPPAGRRGAHFTVSRAARWGTSGTQYLAHHEEELLVVAMIESARGLAAAADILAVDGIDMLFVGPLDLTASFNCMGDYADSRIVAAIEEIPTIAAKLGKWAGCTVLGNLTARRLNEVGYGFVTVGSDVTFLQQAAGTVRRQDRG